MIKSAVVLSYLAALVAVGLGQTCTQVGFFRNPNDCAKFYRCVDLWQNGRELTIYHFDCPPGTVFDETVSVCNWPQQAAPCENGPAVGGGAVTQAPEPVESGVGGGDGGDGVTPGESHCLNINWLLVCEWHCSCVVTLRHHEINYFVY